jgi:hypothetical protein
MRRVRRSGIVTWLPSDVSEAEKIESEFSHDELSAAVQSVVLSGREPVPGRVSQEIERLRQRREAEAAAQARRSAASTAPADPEAAARGREFLESLRRRRAAEAS